MTVAIRLATESDWPAVWRIIASVIAAGDSYTLEADTPEAEARDYWTGAGIVTYVAELDGDIVGTYALRANQRGRGAHVANAGYMVRRDMFAHGIGAALGEHSLVAARAAGYRAMQFNCVVSTNTRAVQLWQRLGFRIVGTVPEAFRHATLGYVDSHIMHRRL